MEDVVFAEDIEEYGFMVEQNAGEITVYDLTKSFPLIVLKDTTV